MGQSGESGRLQKTEERGEGARVSRLAFFGFWRRVAFEVYEVPAWADLQPAAIQAIALRIRLAAARLGKRHCQNEGVRSVRHVFGGGRCGGAAPAQGRAEGPTAHMLVESIEEREEGETAAPA